MSSELTAVLLVSRSLSPSESWWPVLPARLPIPCCSASPREMSLAKSRYSASFRSYVTHTLSLYLIWLCGRFPQHRDSLHIFWVLSLKDSYRESCLDAVGVTQQNTLAEWRLNLALSLLWNNHVQRTIFSTLISTQIIFFLPAHRFASSWYHSHVDGPGRRRHGAAGLRTPTSQR